MGSPSKARRIRGWWRRRSSGDASAQAGDQAQQSAREALAQLSELLDGSALPNGVIELVIEDTASPQRHLLDIHDRQIAPIDPGSAVPWTSVSGTYAAWTRALGAEGDVSQLEHTGEPELAERLLAELQRQRPVLARERARYSVPDCS